MTFHAIHRQTVQHYAGCLLGGAVGDALGGVHPHIQGRIGAVGETALDLCWRMPLDDEYAEGLKTHFADVANVAVFREQVEGRVHASGVHAQLDHRERHVGLNADDDRHGPAQTRHLRES